VTTKKGYFMAWSAINVKEGKMTNYEMVKNFGLDELGLILA